MNNATPYLIAGVALLGVGIIAYAEKPKLEKLLKKGTALNAITKAKVDYQISTSKDPKMLTQLAAGLKEQGADKEAGQAMLKVAEITNKPASIPGIIALPPTIISPGVTQPGSVKMTPTTTSPIPGVAFLTQYKVAKGDIPGAIAKRFQIQLSALAKANGANAKRIMAGSIRENETLKLPIGVVDSGPQNRATGIAS